MQVGAEGDQAEVVTRNDQLTMKSASKAARRDKVAKNKKKKQSKKGNKNAKKGKGKKGKKTTKPDTGSSASVAVPSSVTSPSKRKRKLLKKRSVDASNALAAHEQGDQWIPKRSKLPSAGNEEGSIKTGKRKHSKTRVRKNTARVPAAPKPKAKSKARAKAKASPRASPKASPKPKAKAKAKAKASSRRGSTKGRRNEGDEIDPNLFSQELVDNMYEFARSIGGKGVDTKSAMYKHSIREKLAALDWTAYNIYWSRASCGVKRIDRDVHHFIFTTSTAHESYRCAVACKCAEYAVPCLTNAVRFPSFQHIKMVSAVFDPRVHMYIYIYIYIQVFSTSMCKTK